MPIPQPKSGENQDDFISRCMGDDFMNSEYPDEDQRFAICNNQWKDRKMARDRELRYITFEGFELREGGDTPQLIGYASIFNQEAEIYGLWRETVARGAYKKTIKEHDIRALWNHNTDNVLGRNKAGTLALAEDDHGLKVEIDPPDTQAGRDAVTSIKRGDVSQMSIAFQTIKEEWKIPENKRELPLRTVKEAKLFEVSPVTFPAFEGTEIGARSGLYLPNGEIDPLEEARRLARCALMGMPLSKEQRQIISVAMDLYKPFLLESSLDDNHSKPDESESNHLQSKPEDDHYSNEERERRLQTLYLEIYPVRR